MEPGEKARTRASRPLMKAMMRYHETLEEAVKFTRCRRDLDKNGY